MSDSMKGTGRGGWRPNSGRKKGSLDKYSRQAVMKAFEGGEHPLDHLLRVMRDPDNHKRMRMNAAAIAMPYVLPRLSQATVKTESDIANLTFEEKIALAHSLRSRILEHRPEASIPEVPALEGVASRVEETEDS